MSESIERPRPPITNKQALWDEQIGPLLHRAWLLCDQHDIPFLAAAQTQPDACTLSVTAMSEHASPLMRCVYGVIDGRRELVVPYLWAYIAVHGDAGGVLCSN